MYRTRLALCHVRSNSLRFVIAGRGPLNRPAAAARYPSGSENFDDVTWEDWSNWYQCILKKKVKIKDPLKVITLCSGTDSPVKALAEIIGWGGIDHVFSCDCDRNAELFAQLNTSPLHFYQVVSTSGLNQKTGSATGM